ncbi:MAG: transglutaminase-like domain-containing protein [Thermoproteota archaeon]|nr:transglutaminase-like domain-containing protein [Thermoproteota archaeon]
MDFEYHDNYRIKDWEKNVVIKLNEKENIKEISEYALHIARIINYPNLSIDRYIEQIEEIGEELKRKIKNPNKMRPTHIIEKFNEFFFEDKKFHPNTNDYYNPINNYLNIVLEKKIGIPITLSIIYIHLTSFLNFELQPINFPSHFLVKYILDKDSKEYIIIDPFNKGRIMDDYILQDLLNKVNPKLKVSISNNILAKANTSQILIRILNNLKNGYVEVDDLEKIEIINEMILSLDKFNPEAIRDSGIILFRYKKFKESLNKFYKYIELNPEAEDIDKILELIRQIRNIT